MFAWGGLTRVRLLRAYVEKYREVKHEEEDGYHVRYEIPRNLRRSIPLGWSTFHPSTGLGECSI